MGCGHSHHVGYHPKLLGRSESGKARPASESEGPKLESFVVIRVLRADLLRSFDAYGKMDPFAVVEWHQEGTRKEIARTRIDWNADMHPHWDHTCRGQPFKMAGNTMVEFQVMEGNVIGRPSFCGAAKISIGDLAPEPTSEVGTATGPVLKLELKLASGPTCEPEVTGHVFVQALMVQTTVLGRGKTPGLSRVDEGLFEGPIERLGVSGGSAAFFKLHLKPGSGRAREYFIGKDLSHAEDEVTFYEEALALKRQPGVAGLGPLLSYTLEYAGVLTNTEETSAGEKKTELLVMRNLRCGSSKHRFLDIKIGQKTAQAGWQGKSRVAALRQSMVDGITNSSCEGFRLEGFDGRPPALESMDPLLDLGMTGNAKMAKKALRVMLQRMPAAEMLLHWLDLHQEPSDVPNEKLKLQLCTTEVAEIVCHEAVRSLCGLAVACRRSPMPQKWIGSSVGLGFDSGSLPQRKGGEEEVRKSTLVCIFDWGRSELNTMNKHMQLSEKDQLDRGEFWRYYMGGIDRLAWEAARAYQHRFSCSKWSLLTFKVCDFDSMSENDFIGRLCVPVEETPETCADLNSKDGNHVVGDYGWRGSATLTYSITWRPFPQPSRMKGAWRVHLIRAQHLPRQDKMQLRTTSDPMCEITACAADPKGLLCLRQVSSVKVQHLDPEWGETFDLPVANVEDSHLQEALEGAASGLGSCGDVFLAEKIPTWIREQILPQGMHGRSSSRWSWSENNLDNEALDRALDTWKARLDLASATVSPSSGARCREAPVAEHGQMAAPGEKHKIMTEERRTGAIEAAVLSELDARSLCHKAGSAEEPNLVAVGAEDAIPVLSPPVMIERKGIHQSCWELSGCAACIPST